MNQAMKGSLCQEYETEFPAADVWEVYGGLLAGQLLVPQLVPEVYSKVELVEGDGGVGTVLLVSFPPGTRGILLSKKSIKIYNENYIKEVLIIKGGFLDHGFKNYLIRIEIIGKEEKTSL